MVSTWYQVIGYGLSLPLNIATTEHDPIRDCVHVYCEWLSALLPQPRSAVPLPLLKLPNHYSRKIICQLFQIFIPRPGEGILTSHCLLQINWKIYGCGVLPF
jgi:hypothetical protein